MKIDSEKLVQYREHVKYMTLLPGFIHNINTPLMNISGRIELIGFKNPEVGGLDQIMQQLEKINVMIENLRYMIETEKTEGNTKVDLSELLDNFDQFLHLNMHYKHKIDLNNMIVKGIYVIINPFDAVAVFHEIFDNCIDLMPDGGTITVHAARLKDGIYVTITRAGMKVSNDHLEKLKDISIVDSDWTKVTNLIIAKYVLSRIRGSLSVENKTDGVEYKVRFPL